MLGFLGSLVLLISYFYPALGNLITIAVMRKKEFTQTFHKLLTALAVFDNIFIVSAIFTLAIRLVMMNTLHCYLGFVEHLVFLTTQNFGFSFQCFCL